MSKKANPPPPVPSRGAVALLVLGLAESALALFQWSQLLTLRAGGATVCGVSEHVNCETVWNTPFASRVHEVLGIPVAGLGLLWGLVATGLAGLYLAWRRGGHAVRPAVNSLRMTAAVGVLATAVFASVSATAGALCLTCLGTYVLVLAFAAVAWRGLPGPVVPLAGEWGRALQWAGGFALAGFIALSIPGRATPKASAAEMELPQMNSDPGSLEAYVRGLPSRDQQLLSNALAQYRRDTPLPAKAPARRRFGPVDAPVKIVEWTDSKCPHCKALVEVISVMKKHVPEGKLSLEARQYPLDGACNPGISPEYTDGGLRCLAAKAQICLEAAPDFWELREKLFAAQSTLTPDLVMQIASSGTVLRPQLEACVNSPSTTQRLQEDLAYAQQHDIHGTPLVVVNGREVPPVMSILYALVMAGGDANAPAFRGLPPPQPPGGSLALSWPSAGRTMAKRDKKPGPAAPGAPFNNPFGTLAGQREELPSRPAPAAAPERAQERKGPARAVVRMERKGRGGKEVTVVEQLGLPPAQLEVWLKALKGSLGCGGVVEEDALVLQGDHRDRLPALLEARAVRRVIVG